MGCRVGADSTHLEGREGRCDPRRCVMSAADTQPEYDRESALIVVDRDSGVRHLVASSQKGRPRETQLKGNDTRHSPRNTPSVTQRRPDGQ
ncbi:hypothetical protein E2C01_092338 [Portunus trituberculatus]|uniref:Uncharacterized protein n=1 Tax=Portunus trituberculatus TaxID=210409 RepID=A0A5B7JJU4_PORTR|nr:hypothetical protein [Portunus trituberculatus]